MAKSKKQLVEHLNTRFAELKSLRDSWEPGWRDIARFQLPYAGDFLRTAASNDRGSQKDAQILDGIASEANETLRAGLMTGLTPRTSPWFRLTVEDEKIANNGAVKEWLDNAAKKMLMVFGQFNLYEVLDQVYGETGGFGTGCALIQRDREDIIRLYPQTIGTYWLANNHRNVPDTFIRKYAMSVRSAIREFGEENVSADVRNKKGKPGADKPIMILHCIEPNDEYEPGAFGARGKQYRSVTWEEGKDDCVLRIGGYDKWPVLAPKWRVRSDDPYGTGCGHAVRADVTSLQMLAKRRHVAVDKHVNPPMVFPAQLRNQATGTTPGFVNYVAGNIRDMMGAPLYQSNPAMLAPMMELIGDIRQSVERRYFTPAFLAISRMDGVQPRNQLEILALKEEKLMLLGPVLGSLHGNLLKPLGDYAFETLSDLRMEGYDFFGEPPRELQDQNVEIQLISMLEQAQQATRVQAIERTVGFIGSLVGAFPQAGDKLDVYDAIDKHADAIGTPAGVIKPTEDAEKIAAGRAQQAAAAQAMQTGSALAQGAKTLSEAQVGDRNGLEALTGVQPSMAEAA